MYMCIYIYIFYFLFFKQYHACHVPFGVKHLSFPPGIF